MDFNEYQAKCSETDKGTLINGNDFIYYIISLLGECGELANASKRIYRDDNGILTEQRKAKIIAEVGDSMWYISSLCTKLGVKLEDVAKANIEKLQDRKARGVIHGEGDNR